MSRYERSNTDHKRNEDDKNVKEDKDKNININKDIIALHFSHTR